MGKVSIGLRGWRFEESEVFTEAGEVRPLPEMEPAVRQRVARLMVVAERPCDACFLLHGEAEKRRCNVAEAVYGEPLSEVVLCETHEPDFLYWFREAGGSARRGEEGFRDAFHEWFADGGRAPKDYGGIEHVDTDPASLPEAPDPSEPTSALEDELDAMDADLDDLDFEDSDAR
ncbi:hypothetical protein BRC90_04835 [Halobacteriales archaeon QS_4_69_34]|nr:MAG: hypothetical protein BRC90_04835 [Halobacteriales archaeon QS_4_69_34]